MRVHVSVSWQQEQLLTPRHIFTSLSVPHPPFLVPPQNYPKSYTYNALHPFLGAKSMVGALFCCVVVHLSLAKPGRLVLSCFGAKTSAGICGSISTGFPTLFMHDNLLLKAL